MRGLSRRALLQRVMRGIVFPLLLATSGAGPVGAHKPPWVLAADTHPAQRDELLLIFIGATFCGAATRPGFPAVVEKAKRVLAQQAVRDKKSFASIGIAVDNTVPAGLQFLGAFGKFDELIVGRNWLNSGAIKYIWKDVAGTPGIPRLLVVERTVLQADNAITFGPERLVLRKLGLSQIERWVAAQQDNWRR